MLPSLLVYIALHVQSKHASSLIDDDGCQFVERAGVKARSTAHCVVFVSLTVWISVRLALYHRHVGVSPGEKTPEIFVISTDLSGLLQTHVSAQGPLFEIGGSCVHPSLVSLFSACKSDIVCCMTEGSYSSVVRQRSI